MATKTKSKAETEQAVRMEIEDGIAIVTLDLPGKPVNVLNAQMIEEITEILGQLETGGGGARAAVILSGKPGNWIAGADIEEFRKWETAEDGERASRTGQELLGRLENLPIPVVAAIDGVALGGGLEMALACEYRIATSSPKTKLGLPEVQLGILPGAGGSQRLPRLVGIRAALDLMLTGKQLDGRRAKSIGLVDEVVPPEILRDVALRAARDLADGTREPRAARPKGSPQWIENLPGMRALIFSKARQGVMEKTRGMYPAPLRILDVVERGIDKPLDRALEIEAEGFGELSVTPEARALVHLFFATTAAKNDPGVDTKDARDVERMAMIGAGFMGAGIAAVSAEAGIRVRLKDVKPEAVARGLRTARDILTKRAKRKKSPKFAVTELVDRVEATHEYTGFRSVDLVVEAVFEDLELKHRIIRDAEPTVGKKTIFASNTSTIPIAQLARASKRPEQMLGLHFFSPVEKMPLLEIIVTPETADWVTATGHRYAKKIGKTPIIVSDSPGFYANRILGPYMAEALQLLEEGVRIEKIDRALTDWGYAVGPITLYDEVGLDVALKAGTVMADAFPDRFEPSPIVQRMNDEGRLGRKSGRGFFLYEDGKKGGVDPEVYKLFGNPEPRKLPIEEIRDRCALLMINEAVRCLEEGVLRAPSDGDVGAVLGIGFPPFRGGPFWYLDTAGPRQVLDRLRELESRYGPRFAPAALLVEKAEAGDRFGE